MTEPLRIDLTRPHVQQMLGGDPRLATVKRELVQVAGDVPHPDGTTPWRGHQSQVSLTGDKQEVLVMFREMILTVDVYVIGEHPVAYLVCPRCRKVLTVRGDQKAIDFDPFVPNPVRAEIAAAGDPTLTWAARLGRLSIEGFECTWELDDAPHVQGAVHTGASLCRMRLAIDNNRARIL